MERYFEVANALIKSGGVIWDDHNGGSEGKLIGIAALLTGNKVIPVGLHKADFFTLNRVYLEGDKVHLSSESVAGVLFPVNHRDLWECINDYNDKQVNNKFSCGTLENVMALEPVPVTVITMTVNEFNKKVGLPAPVQPEPEVIISDRIAERKDILEKVLSGDTKVTGIPTLDLSSFPTDGGQNHQFESGRIKSLNVDFHPTDGIGDFPDKPNP